MANHLDLEEQEQLDQLKHFWNTWGTLISAALVLVFGSLAAWNGYQYWQARQAVQASALLEAVEVAARAGEAERLEQAFTDIRNKYASTLQAAQAGLLVAKVAHEQGRTDNAKAALTWVAGQAADDGYRAMARLRLASVLMGQEAYDEALSQLSAAFPPEFEALAADRKGDIKALQGKKPEAIAEYERAHKAFTKNVEYRRLVEFKLNALGVTLPQIAVAQGAAATTETVR